MSPWRMPQKAIAYAGIGSNFDEAIRPGCIDLDGTRIAFSAIGIMTGDQPQYRAGPNKPGQASYRDRPDFEAAVEKLVAMPADYRILSIHYGLEGRVDAGRPAARRLAQATPRSRRISISSSATIRMWCKASSSTASR